MSRRRLVGVLDDFMALQPLGRPPTAADVVAAARAGDACARAIVTEAGRCLGAALATLVNLFDPEMVVVGGGVVESDDLLFSIAARSATDRLSPPQVRRVSLRRGLLGQRAAVVGVALLVREHVTASTTGTSPPRESSATTSA